MNKIFNRLKPETMRSFDDQAEAFTWKAEPVNVAKLLEELSKVVKSQSSIELAGSWRNISKYAVLLYKINR